MAIYLLTAKINCRLVYIGQFFCCIFICHLFINHFHSLFLMSVKLKYSHTIYSVLVTGYMYLL